MNKYYELLDRLLAELDRPDVDARRSVYSRALAVAQAQLVREYDQDTAAAEIAEIHRAIAALEDRWSAGENTTQEAAALASGLQPPEIADIAPGPDGHASPVRQNFGRDEAGQSEPEPSTTDYDFESFDTPDGLEPDLPPEAQQDESRAPSPAFIISAMAFVLAAGMYVYFNSPDHIAVTLKSTTQWTEGNPLPKGIASRRHLSQKNWQFGAATAPARWVLETRTAQSPDYVLSRKVIRAQASFEPAGMTFTVSFGWQRNISLSPARSINVKYQSTRGDATQILKMYSPKIRIAGSNDSTELDAIVIRLGLEGFLVNLTGNKTEIPVNRALLERAIAIEFPFLLESGKAETLVVALPDDFFATLEAAK